MKILLATNNPAKIALMKKWCLLINGAQFFSPNDLGIDIEVLESGKTLRENAEIKAREFSLRAPSHIVIANDCGVDIPSLGRDWKKVWTNRQLGSKQSSDLERAASLIELMKGKAGEDRKISWSDAIALAYNGKIIDSFEKASPHGYILDKMDERACILPGSPIGGIDFRSEFGKVYNRLTEEELMIIDKVVNEF